MDFQLSLQAETIRSVYPETPVAVEPTTPISDVVRLMQAEKAAAVLVVEGDRLVGVFTERDVLRLLAEAGDLTGPIAGVMSGDPATVTETDTVGDAIKQMSEGGYRHLPVVADADAATPTGMVDVRGVMRYLVEHFPSTIYNLPPYTERAASSREGA